MAQDKPHKSSRALAAELIHAAMTILRKNGKEMPMRDLMEKVGATVDLDDWARARYAKTGHVRWQSVFHFFSIDCVKAGFLLKKNAIWYLTPEGEAALSMEPMKLLESAQKAYRKWRAEKIDDIPEAEEEAEGTEPSLTFEEMEQAAKEGLEHFINEKNPYEFQDLVAALLRGMGYYTPFVAPKGKDGGIDIVAYRDPLGTQSPRIQVQVKHREASATAKEIRQLIGLPHQAGDVGIFVSSSGFTPDAKAAARGGNIHIELIDLARFITLWQEFYSKLSDEDKALLPLRPIYFLAEQEK